MEMFNLWRKSRKLLWEYFPPPTLPLYSSAKGLNLGLVRINLWWFLQDSHHDINTCLRFLRFLVRNFWLVRHWCCQFQDLCIRCQNSQHQSIRRPLLRIKVLYHCGQWRTQPYRGGARKFLEGGLNLNNIYVCVCVCVWSGLIV
jgi:hypothetical protein